MKALIILLLAVPASGHVHPDAGLHHVIEAVPWFRAFCLWAPVFFAGLLTYLGRKG